MNRTRTPKMQNVEEDLTQRHGANASTGSDDDFGQNVRPTCSAKISKLVGQTFRPKAWAKSLGRKIQPKKSAAKSAENIRCKNSAEKFGRKIRPKKSAEIIGRKNPPHNTAEKISRTLRPKKSAEQFGRKHSARVKSLDLPSCCV